MRLHQLVLDAVFFLCIFICVGEKDSIAASEVQAGAELSLLDPERESRRNGCDNILNLLEKDKQEENHIDYRIQNKDKLLACYAEFEPDKLWQAHGALALAYLLKKMPEKTLIHAEKSFALSSKTETLDKEGKRSRLEFLLAYIGALGLKRDFRRALPAAKDAFLDSLELPPPDFMSEFICAAGWVYILLNKSGTGIFYSKLSGGGIYVEGEDPSRDQAWKDDLTRYLTHFNRTDELALLDKLPAGPSPEDISPFSPARVLMVGPEIALFDRFERLATALQEAAASDDPAALHAARENMRAWMDEVEREL